jgi:hypothetical protein
MASSDGAADSDDEHVCFAYAHAYAYAYVRSQIGAATPIAQLSVMSGSARCGYVISTW